MLIYSSYWLSDQGPDVPFETKPGQGWLVRKPPFEDMEMPEPAKIVRFVDIVPASSPLTYCP